MPANEHVPQLEALLFLHGEPLQLGKIARVLELEREALKGALLGLEKELLGESRGLALVSDRDLEAVFGAEDWEKCRVQLSTRPEFAPIMAEFVKDELEEDLTPAALETLSLILYLGPVPRSKIDYLRGVNSSFIVRNLLLRGLVERYPDPERPHIYIYRATLDALKHLGVVSPEELPEYARFRELAVFDQKAEVAPQSVPSPEPHEGA